MRRLYADGYDLADNLLTAFVKCGYWLTPNTKILDYGCGEGALVYRLRDIGFDAYGFDIHARVAYRTPEDRRFFGFVTNPEKDDSIMTIEDDLMRIPFPDDTFDVVVSSHVIEHVMNLSLVMSEIARVLKPDGFTFHVYPKRSMIIEPHMYVPLGTRVQNWWWYYFWALLGVRNEFLAHLEARELADNNARYSRTGVRYLTPPQLYEVCTRYFETARFVDDSLNIYPSFKDLWQRRLAALRSENRMKALSLTQLSSALLTANKRVEIREPIEMAMGRRVIRYFAQYQLFGYVARNRLMRYIARRVGLIR